MAREIWINLPVRDPVRARDFFGAIGFTVQPQHPGTDGAGFVVGDKEVQVMLFPEATFRQFIRKENAEGGTEVLFSLGADSREAVDELARKVVAAGGTLFADPEEIQGWMYGCGFEDLDGHRWNALYMDPAGP